MPKKAYQKAKKKRKLRLNPKGLLRAVVGRRKALDEAASMSDEPKRKKKSKDSYYKKQYGKAKFE